MCLPNIPLQEEHNAASTVFRNFKNRRYCSLWVSSVIVPCTHQKTTETTTSHKCFYLDCFFSSCYIYYFWLRRISSMRLNPPIHVHRHAVFICTFISLYFPFVLLNVPMLSTFYSTCQNVYIGLVDLIRASQTTGRDPVWAAKRIGLKNQM